MSVESTFEGIRPCPFCGQEADLVFDGALYSGGYIKVKCLICGAQSRGVYYRGDIKGPLEDMEQGMRALRQWNNRAEDRLERLEKLLLKALETK